MSTIPFFTIRCRPDERETVLKVLQFIRTGKENQEKLTQLLQGQEGGSPEWKAIIEARLAKVENWLEQYERSLMTEEALLDEIASLPDSIDIAMYEEMVEKLENQEISDETFHEGMAQLEQKRATPYDEEVLPIEDVTESWRQKKGYST